MNRKLLALAVTAALAAPLAAQAAPTVYGQLNLSLDMVDAESVGVDAWEVNSNSSRLGVKGEEALSNGYSAVYKAEWGVSGDGDAADLGQRDRYLGLKANWGTLKLGNFDSPLKTSQGSVDQFNDMTYTDLANVMAGDNRLANSIGYESPKIADAITIKVTLQPGETTGGDDGVADAISASVAYEQGGLYLAAAVDQGGEDGVQLDEDTIRVTATYTMDALQLGAMVQNSEPSDGSADDVNSFLVSAAYTMGKNVLKGQFMSTEDVVDVIAVGGEHNFTGMTKAYVHVAMGDWDNDDQDTVVSLGMQTKF